MAGWLDRVPAEVRHLIFACSSVAALALLQWVQAGGVQVPAPLQVVVAAVVPVLIAYVTPFTRQYGVGSDRVGDL